VIIDAFSKVISVYLLLGLFYPIISGFLISLFMKATNCVNCIVLLFVALFIFFSCKKQNIDSSPAARLIGKWEKVGFATDDNSNGIIDQWEKNATSTEIINAFEFKKDSTGVEFTTQSPDLGFVWYFGINSSLYTIYNTGDTFVYKVLLLTGTDLHISTISNIGMSAYYYKKR
jgi:hypothetical protein